MSKPLPYKKYRGPKQWDVIIIGSGLSGLTAASMLSQEGKKVLVLERHYTAGGYTHVFKRRDYEWDVGLHYVGDFHVPYTPSAKVWKYISDGTMGWEPMGDVYDRIVMPDKTYDFCTGKKALQERLIEYFPEEEEAIVQYFQLLKTVTSSSRQYYTEKALPPIASKLAGGRLRKGLLKYASRSTRDVLSELTQNERLIGVLAGQYGDHGLPPAQSSFAIHCMVVSHYLKGACYPIGGSGRIAESIMPVIRKGGGEVLVRAEVDEILLERGRAKGVKMSDGETFKADTVISCAGYWNTMYKLLPESRRPKQSLEELGLVPSTGHVCLYIGLKHTDAELNLGKANLWVYPGYNHDDSVANFLADDKSPLPVTYISFPSSKDPTWQDRYPGTSTIEIITIAPYEIFEKWETERWSHRGEEYEAFKEEISQRMLAELYKHVPQVKGKIDTYELSTPLSTKHFMNYEKGELYGLDHTPDRFEQSKLKPRTPVKGLYLTGQDVVTVGISGALFSGVLTASAITRKNILQNIMKQEA